MSPPCHPLGGCDHCPSPRERWHPGPNQSWGCQCESQRPARTSEVGARRLTPRRPWGPRPCEPLFCLPPRPLSWRPGPCCGPGLVTVRPASWSWGPPPGGGAKGLAGGSSAAGEQEPVTARVARTAGCSPADDRRTDGPRRGGEVVAGVLLSWYPVRPLWPVTSRSSFRVRPLVFRSGLCERAGSKGSAGRHPLAP